MNPETTLWILTTGGAAVFFAAGWAASVLRSGQAPASVSAVAVGEAQRIARLEAELPSVREEAARARELAVQNRELVERLRAAEAGEASLRAEHAGDKEAWAKTGAEQQSRIEELQRRIEELQADRGGLAEQASNAKKVHEQLFKTTQRLAEATARAERSARVELELGAAQREVQELRDRLEAERSRVQQAEELRGQLVAMREQGRSDEAARAEAASLRAQLQDTRIRLTQAEARIGELREQRDELARSREEQEGAIRELERLRQIEEEAKGLRHRLQASESKLLEAEEIRLENQELRDRLREMGIHAEASGEVERLQGEVKRLRLEGELSRRRILELEVDVQGHGETKERLEEMTQLASEAQELRARVKGLEAKLFATGAQEPMGIHDTAPGSGRMALDAGPTTLVSAGAKTAVLADGAGLLIAGAGASEVHEGLAALSGLVFEFAERVSNLVPVSGIRTVRLTAGDDIVVAWGLLRSGGDPYAIAAIGSGPLEDTTMESACGVAANSVMTVESSS